MQQANAELHEAAKENKTTIRQQTNTNLPQGSKQGQFYNKAANIINIAVSTSQGTSYHSFIEELTFCNNNVVHTSRAASYI